MTTTTQKPPSKRQRTSAKAGRASAAGDRRLGRVLLAIVGVWVIIGLYVVHSQLPSSTLSLPGQDAMESSIRTVAPQGWAFFTKSPRDPHTVLWKPGDDGGWSQALYAPHAEPRNAFGLNRRSRAQPVELGLLLGAVPAERWQDCRLGDIPTCLAGTSAVAVDNPSPRPMLCGSIGASRQEPLPWAWAEAADRTTMPATAARLDVRC